MPEAYAHAILTLVEKGSTPHDAVQKVFASLSERGRTGLAKQIQKAFVRLASAKQRKEQTTLFVAHEKDAKKYRTIAGAKEAVVVVDSTLIGGWRLETHDTVTDMSWKKHLLAMYQRTVNI